MDQRTVYYIDRKTKTKKKEEIYGEAFLLFLYKKNFFNKIIAKCIAHCTLFSRMYGCLQKTRCSKKKIAPFIAHYQINPDEFVKHKILDVIGDLYLLGHNMIGAFSGFKSGHALNSQLMHALLAQPDAWELITFDDEKKAPECYQEM